MLSNFDPIPINAIAGLTGAGILLLDNACSTAPKCHIQLALSQTQLLAPVCLDSSGARGLTSASALGT